MKVRNALFTLGLIAALTASNPSFAQTATPKLITPIAASAATAVPSLIPYSGAAVAVEGRPPTGDRGVTFQIFKDETGGEPLWIESQTVTLDSIGHYTVHLGATSPNGLPTDLFATGEARWLEVQIAGQSVQPRVLLASVPYALKAADATTLGGLPASAYALAGTRTATGAVSAAIHPDIVSNVTTTGGTSGYVPVFNGASTVIDSPVFVSGADVGIGTTTPTAALDVAGTTILGGAVTVNSNAAFNGSLTFEPTNTATASAGHDSQALKFYASAYNSTHSTAVNPRFYLQAEPQGNNTASPTGTLNLLATSGAGSAVETGFYFNANGTMNFAPGQTFPGADITGVVNASGYNIGGSSFATGSTGSGNGFFGFSGNSSATGEDNAGVGLSALTGLTTGTGNVAAGAYVLHNNTTGSYNIAAGYGAAYSNTTANFNAAFGTDALYDNTGSYNTAVGPYSLFSNTTGTDNTGLGYEAGPSSGALTNATAIGYNSKVSQNNTLVLGQTTSGNPGNTFVNVGIGTATPISSLEMSVSASQALGPVLTLTNPGDTNDQFGAAVAIDFNTTAIPSSNYYPSDRIEAIDDGSGSANLEFLTGGCCGLTEVMGIYADGEVHVESQFTVAGNQQFNVESLAFNNDDAFYGAGGDASSTTNNGGNGGDFYGGNAESGTGGDGIYASAGLSNVTNGYAGYFAGNVHVTGALSVSGVKNFKIDDPIDPANKYLVHASVESSEMMNIYSGNVTTDDLGLATVTLPSWFQSENGDFRYQLTVIGGRFAQAVVSKEIANNQFTISTNATGVKVSWQVTAVRQDAYAKANPMVVEETKPANERGFYEHPEYYGQPASKQTEWGRHPLAMQQAKGSGIRQS